MAKDPDHEFVVYPDRDLRWTYRDFDERTDQLAKGLMAIGMKPGDHLGVWARNIPDWLTFMYACAKAGTAEEIAVVKLKDAGDAAAMMDSLHQHVEARQGTFREYDPAQVPLTENAVVTREGRYVALIVCEKNGLVQNVFRDYFKES